METPEKTIGGKREKGSAGRGGEKGATAAGTLDTGEAGSIK